MIIISVQIIPEDKPKEIIKRWDNELIDINDFKLKEQVIVKTEMGVDLGEIVKIEEKKDFSGEIEEKGDKKMVLRKASAEDLDKYEKKNQEKNKAIEEIKRIVKEKKLPVKVINLVFSFDGSRLTIVFTAPARIDFRELVKGLSHFFHRSVRMLQLGVRDEAEKLGNIGPCGNTLCCKKFLKKITSISTGLLSSQQLFSRGSERMTGVCGRLKCCLAFEEKIYKELSKNLPPLGSEIKVGDKKGKVVEWLIIKQKVVVETSDGTKIEVKVDEISM